MIDSNDFRIDTFIVAPSNKGAFEVVMAQDSGIVLIVGGSGNGKTHLAVASCNKRARQRPHACILSTERFKYEFRLSLEKNKLELFRERYSKAQQIYLEHIHTIYDDQEAQIELIRLLDICATKKCLVVLDTTIEGLIDAPNILFPLRQYLAQAKVAMIEDPEPDLLLKVLRQRGNAYGLNYSDSVLTALAGVQSTSVRATIGILNRLSAAEQYFNYQVNTPEEALDLLSRFTCSSLSQANPPPK